MTDTTLPEPVAWRLRWIYPATGQPTSWLATTDKVVAQQKERDGLEVDPLYPAAALQEALDRAEEAKTSLLTALEHHTGERHGIMAIRQLVDRATTAEAKADAYAVQTGEVDAENARLVAALATAEKERDAAHNEALEKAAARLRLVFAISGEPYALQVLYLKKETPNANR